jgi:AcrR family transcriptional regulator
LRTVTQSERARLLEAMLEELVDKGYPEVEVEAAVERAHLSGDGWSQLFGDKDACLVAAFEQLTEQLRAAIGRGCASAGVWPERVAAGLAVLLAQLASRALMAEALARSFPAIGPAAQARYHAFVEGLAPLLAEGREFSGTAAELPGEVELLAVGAAEAIVFEQIQAGRTAELAGLGPEILFSVLVPFLGPVVAAAEMEKARVAQSFAIPTRRASAAPR